MKLRKKSAEKGHSLLKKKSDALTIRFREISLKIREVCERTFFLQFFGNLNIFQFFVILAKITNG